jgi:hypothetical protein
MKLCVGIVACSLLLALAMPSRAATQPVTGIYAESRYIQSATPTDGATCIETGASLGGYLDYPGPLKSGATEYVLLTDGGGTGRGPFR